MSLTLPNFFAELDDCSKSVPLDLLTHHLAKLEISLDDIRKHLQFGVNTYKRNLIHEGPGYQALVLCWRSGQRSPIHDHRGSNCGVRVLSGVATETFFEQTEDGWIYATGSRDLGESQVFGSQDTDIHQVSNLRPRGENLVTLHVYSPALLVMGTYSLTDATRGQFTDPVYAFVDGAGI